VSCLREARYYPSGRTGSITSLNVRFSHLMQLTYHMKCSVDFWSCIVYMINLCINDTRLGQLDLATESGALTMTLFCIILSAYNMSCSKNSLLVFQSCVTLDQALARFLLTTPGCSMSQVISNIVVSRCTSWIVPSSKHIQTYIFRMK
jgi:hypothetical protein